MRQRIFCFFFILAGTVMLKAQENKGIMVEYETGWFIREDFPNQVLTDGGSSNKLTVKYLFTEKFGGSTGFEHWNFNHNEATFDGIPLSFFYKKDYDAGRDIVIDNDNFLWSLFVGTLLYFTPTTLEASAGITPGLLTQGDNQRYFINNNTRVHEQLTVNSRFGTLLNVNAAWGFRIYRVELKVRPGFNYFLGEPLSYNSGLWISKKQPHSYFSLLLGAAYRF